MNLDDHEDRIVAAGEYVLGTLDAATRAEVEARRRVDAALDAQIYRWQDQLLGLHATLPAIAPPSQAWSAIETRLASASVQAAAPDSRGGREARDAARPGAVRPDTDEAANDSLWRRLKRWQWGGGLAIAASVLLAAALVWTQAMPPAPRYLTLLQTPEGQRTGWVVEATPGERIRLVAVGPAEPVPAGKTLQFWTKAKDANAPTSLGLVRQWASLELPAARAPSIGEEQLFELTLEPEQGSPTGRPTGPILFVGRSVRL